jgi:hypothetical protein
MVAQIADTVPPVFQQPVIRSGSMDMALQFIMDWLKAMKSDISAGQDKIEKYN